MHRPFRSGLARPVVAATVLVAGLAVAAGPLAAPPSGAAPVTAVTAATRASAARAGAAWLAGRLTPAGFVPTARDASVADYPATAGVVLALRAAGANQAQARSALGYLQRNVAAAGRVEGVDDAGRLAQLILAADAMGADPKAFGGKAAVHNLVARLRATRRTTGADTGLFGAQDPTYDGAYRQGLALAALAAAGRKDSAGVAWLRRQQCADGSWMAYRASVGAPCPKSDPATFSGPDTNSTALAVQGLVAQGVKPAAATTAWLLRARGADGGFTYYLGGPSDASSTALVVQALLALQVDPGAARVVGATPGPYAYLTSLQLPCTAPADAGAVAFQPETDGSRTANQLSTLQAVPALAGTPFPLKATASRAVSVASVCKAA